jgi:archaellum biogenesis ATPase FlaH
MKTITKTTTTSTSTLTILNNTDHNMMTFLAYFKAFYFLGYIIILTTNCINLQQKNSGKSRSWNVQLGSQ